jgi:hypothetical protein
MHGRLSWNVADLRRCHFAPSRTMYENVLLYLYILSVTEDATTMQNILHNVVLVRATKRKLVLDRLSITEISYTT